LSDIPREMKEQGEQRPPGVKASRREWWIGWMYFLEHAEHM